MNILRDFFGLVKKNCNDDVCLMIVFIVIGFLLCYLFKDRISGFANFAPFGENNERVGVNKSDNNKIVGIANEQAIGIELKPRKPEPSPSTKRALEVMAQKAPVSSKPINQKTGLLVQDSMMFKPFDEIWNPGFMPLDMVFKNVDTKPKNIMGPDRPQGGPQGAQAGPMPAQGSQVGPKPSSTGGEVNLVLLYAPWCGHSKRMLPDYERVKNEFNGKNIGGNNINVLMYDSDVDKDKIKEYGVKGFPTLYIEKNGNRELFPHRTYDKISEYLNNL